MKNVICKNVLRSLGWGLFLWLSVGPASASLFLTSGVTNPQNNSVDYFDLSPSPNSSSNDTTEITTSSSASGSGSLDLLFSPNESTSPSNAAPGGTATGYGFEEASGQTLACDIPAGTWTFSNRYQVNSVTASGTLSLYQEVAVYAYNSGTDISTLLFTAIAPTPFTTNPNSGFGGSTSFSVSEGAFSGIAGDYLKVEYYLHETYTSGYPAVTAYLQFNTSTDYVLPPSGCGSGATNTATQTQTNTPTGVVTNTATATASFTSTNSPTATPTLTATPNGTYTATPVPTITFTPTPAASPNLPGPNPFTPNQAPNNTTTFNLPAGHGSGTLMIFDLHRRPLRTINFTVGVPVVWDGKNDSGSVVEGGLYLYLLNVGGQGHRGTITVLR